MKRTTLLGVGLVLAGVAEIQWATVFFVEGEPLLSGLLFAAGAGMLLAAGGALVAEIRQWAVWAGLTIGAVAHLTYFIQTLSFGTILVGAAGAAAAGLLAAAWGARVSNAAFERGGFALAAVGGVVWVVADVMGGTLSFMVGNAFATVGWVVAAVFAGADEP